MIFKVVVNFFKMDKLSKKELEVLLEYFKSESEENKGMNNILKKTIFKKIMSQHFISFETKRVKQRQDSCKSSMTE